MSVELPIDAVVDARGLSCPLPLLKAKQALNSMLAGQTLHVMATDAGSERDFQRFAELSGNRLLQARAFDGEFHYWLRKAD
ncbi:sulfurtransferase TusA family protein [Halopseudomonas maritima]|uniref:sulfurtransferase TusA family protein n=1 Tax=Halopseudomonas maritima TaxID=2918528 RepID=UPI001EEA1143|nr:sulfurtransferase TusA family protein [Halopseudomonas maritima]UJJ32281.1 sulfurtransferase TusA family protein [Halopseudomonas maritima]